MAIILNKTKHTSGSSAWNANIYSTNSVSFTQILTIHCSGAVPDSGKALNSPHRKGSSLSASVTGLAATNPSSV